MEEEEERQSLVRRHHGRRGWLRYFNPALIFGILGVVLSILPEIGGILEISHIVAWSFAAAGIISAVFSATYFILETLKTKRTGTVLETQITNELEPRQLKKIQRLYGSFNKFNYLVAPAFTATALNVAATSTNYIIMALKNGDKDKDVNSALEKTLLILAPLSSAFAGVLTYLASDIINSRDGELSIILDAIKQQTGSHEVIERDRLEINIAKVAEVVTQSRIQSDLQQQGIIPPTEQDDGRMPLLDTAESSPAIIESDPQQEDIPTIGQTLDTSPSS